MSRSGLAGLGLHLRVAVTLHRTAPRQYSLSRHRLHMLYSPGHGQENAPRHGFCSISLVTELLTSNTGEQSNATHFWNAVAMWRLTLFRPDPGESYALVGPGRRL